MVIILCITCGWGKEMVAGILRSVSCSPHSFLLCCPFINCLCCFSCKLSLWPQIRIKLFLLLSVDFSWNPFLWLENVVSVIRIIYLCAKKCFGVLCFPVSFPCSALYLIMEMFVLINFHCLSMYSHLRILLDCGLNSK